MGWREEGGFDPNDYTDILDYVPALRDYEFRRHWKPKHPELFAYLDDKSEWVREFIHPDLIRAEENEAWGYLLEEPVRDVFMFPFLTPRLCRMLTEEAEHFDHFLGEIEGPNRAFNYATTDVRLESLPHPDNGEGVLNTAYVELMHRFLQPIVSHVWKYDIEFYFWPFLARYTPREQQALNFHHDVCTLALIVTLNEEGEDFEGGGTIFEREQYHHRNAPVGYASVHPSRLTHRHGAKAVTKGTRYVLNTFIT